MCEAHARAQWNAYIPSSSAQRDPTHTLIQYIRVLASSLISFPSVGPAEPAVTGLDLNNFAAYSVPGRSAAQLWRRST